MKIYVKNKIIENMVFERTSPTAAASCLDDDLEAGDQSSGLARDRLKSGSFELRDQRGFTKSP